MDNQRYHLKGLVKKISESEEGVIESAIASSEVIDRMGEVVKIDGIDLTNFKKNPILLWAHNAGLTESRPPIGKVTKTWVEGVKKKRLMFSIKFDMNDDFAAMVWQKFKDGFLNAFSIGFIPLEMEGDSFVKSELLEISAVPVPANPEALAILRSAKMDPVDWKGFFDTKKKEVVIEDEENKTDEEEEKEDQDPDKTDSDEPEKEGEDEKPQESKGIVAYEATPTLGDGAGWDGPAARSALRKWASSDGSGDKDKIDWDKYKKGFAWFDADSPEEFASYKLPHHDIDGEELKTNWRGVAAAMASLLGARGEADIPEEDRKAVYNHLSKHYAQYERDVPEFRDFRDIKETFDALMENKKDMDVNKIRDVIREELKSSGKANPQKIDTTDLPIDDALKIIVRASNLALEKINKKKIEGR